MYLIGVLVHLFYMTLTTGVQKLIVCRNIVDVNNSRCTKRQVMRVEKLYVTKPHILYIIGKI